MTPFETLSQSKSPSLKLFLWGIWLSRWERQLSALNLCLSRRMDKWREGHRTRKGNQEREWRMSCNFSYCKEIKGLRTRLYYTVVVKITLPQLCISSNGENARMSQLPGIMMEIGCIIYLHDLQTPDICNIWLFFLYFYSGFEELHVAFHFYPQKMEGIYFLSLNLVSVLLNS